MRWRKGRQQDAIAPTASTEADPADELRKKLAESREDEQTAAAPEASVAERRAEVHEQGRAALDEMSSDEA